MSVQRNVDQVKENESGKVGKYSTRAVLTLFQTIQHSTSQECQLKSPLMQDLYRDFSSPPL